PGVARSQAIGDTQSTDAVDAAPVIMARRPRRDGEPQVNVLAETGWAGTPQMTFTQLPSGVALPAMLDASGQNELNNDTRQSASPLSKSTGLDVSAVARSPMVDMPTALASEMATAVQRHPLELLNQANDDLTTTQQVALPISATTAPSRSDDRDNLKAQSLRSENRASVTLNDSFWANVTAALKQSDGMHRSPFTERPLEIDPEANPATSGLADATTVKRDGEPSQPAMAAASPGDEHSAAKDGWQGQPREGDGQANPSMVAGAAPARLDEPYRGATAAPAWRPMVERLARDIGEHFRVGERQAVLQLDPPELGKVKIELRIEDGQLHVRIAAEGQESHALIEHHLPELHQALRAGQIDFGEVRVTQDEWKGSGDLAQGFSQSPQGRQESPRSFASSAVVDEPMTEHLAQPSRSVDGRVSMWA
ncbi:MAG: flagellar hook-length control protein FliK, partial [Candidatus Binatia bacterium]